MKFVAEQDGGIETLLTVLKQAGKVRTAARLTLRVTQPMFVTCRAGYSSLHYPVRDARTLGLRSGRR